VKQRAPAFQFYPRQFAGDDQVMGMDLEAVGAHILLMCAAASSPDRCRIDADEYAIRMRLRNPSDEAWERIKKQLLGGAWKLTADGKWWVQDGLQRTFQKQKEFSEQQSQRANARWGNNNARDVPNSCRNNAGEMPEGVPEGCSSSSSSSSSSKNKTMSSKADAFDAALEEIFHYYLITLKKIPACIASLTSENGKPWRVSKSVADWRRNRSWRTQSD